MMRVGIATVHTPGVHGGAELHAEGLADAVREAGHQVHQISMPFYYDRAEATGVALDNALATDFTRFGGGQIDRLICLKFPAYAFKHPDKRVWLLHQHRPAYDLFGTAYGWQPGNPVTDELRRRVMDADKCALSDARALYANSQRVRARLKNSNGIDSTVLYHPPAGASEFYNAPAEPYILVPSRLEELKRQDLLLRALAVAPAPMIALSVGAGGLQARLQAEAEALGLSQRVRFLGKVSRPELLALYARATAVFFGPLDEDYGYITLEAMLSGKPVVTCKDSGGPLEFVLDGETGYVTDPEPEAIAAALSRLMEDPAHARTLGANGRARYEAMNITWSHVVETLLADLPEASA